MEDQVAGILWGSVVHAASQNVLLPAGGRGALLVHSCVDVGFIIFFCISHISISDFLCRIVTDTLKTAEMQKFNIKWLFCSSISQGKCVIFIIEYILTKKYSSFKMFTSIIVNFHRNRLRE